MISSHKFTFNPFQENTYVLYDESKSAVIVDPGCYTSSEENELADFIRSQDLKVEMVLNTHCHVDHVLGNEFAHRQYGQKPILHKSDLPILKSVSQYGEAFGIRAEESPDPQRFMEDGERIKFGSSELEVIHIPGHSPGHVVLYDRNGKQIWGGDVLFLGSIGRTDLPGGDHQTLITSIKTKLLGLDEDIKVYPGHGPATTIGYEKKNNPFLTN